MEFDRIERWWEHFIFRGRIRQPTTKKIPRYLGNCTEVLARAQTFVVCCQDCHRGHNWREVHIPREGWYQTCCAVEDAANRKLRKK